MSIVNPSQPNQAGLRNAVRLLLRPVVRLLLRRGYTHPWLVEEVKQAFVEVALEELDEGERSSHSRVNLLTGIQRPEIKRIRTSDQPKAMSRPHPVAALISHWFADWSDGDGAAKPLPRVESSGDLPTFFELAERATRRNVAPATFLQDCLDRGIVRVDEPTNTVHLVRDAFVPDGGLDDKLQYLGANGGDHLEAAVSNVLGDARPFFDRSVLFHHFASEDAAALEKLARKLAMESLKEVNREARKRAKSGRKGNVRFNFGSYIYRVEQPAEEESAEE